MKQILCYGDSNTYGTNPLPFPARGRWSWTERWTGQLQKLLGEDYHIIEEGLGGRTTAWSDSQYPGRNGKEYLPICLQSHSPLDMIVIMLGTNDLKRRFGVSAQEIAMAAGDLVRDIKMYTMEDKTPEILLVSPILLAENISEGFFGVMFDRAGYEKSLDFAKHFEAVSKECGCHFFDAATVASPSKEDKLHMNLESHTALARALFEKVTEIFSNQSK